MIIPELLKPGDKIGILAPARKIDPAAVDFARHIFTEWGLKVVLSKNLFSGQHSYLSGTDDERLADLQSMIDDHSIRAIICARGGYGSTRIVDDLDLSGLKENAKWLVGFSDITALHLRFLSSGLASIHGIMPVLFSKPDSASSIESLKTLLFEGTCNIKIQPNDFNKIGKSEGLVIGGNLSLIADAMGTWLNPDTTNKILIVEEVDEQLYKIDRMITQLKRAGKLKNLNGFIVGHLTDCKDGELSFGEKAEEIMMNAVKEYKYPVAFNFPYGHENPNLSWINGGFATFSVGKEGASLSFSSIQKKY